MIIHYSNKLVKQLEDSKSIKRAYGEKLGTRIQTVISILYAANCLADVPNLPPTRRHKLSENYADCWAIDVSKNFRLIIKSNVKDLDPRNVTDVTILDICDYH